MRATPCRSVSVLKWRGGTETVANTGSRIARSSKRKSGARCIGRRKLGDVSVMYRPRSCSESSSSSCSFARARRSRSLVPGISDATLQVPLWHLTAAHELLLFCARPSIERIGVADLHLLLDHTVEHRKHFVRLYSVAISFFSSAQFSLAAQPLERLLQAREHVSPVIWRFAHHPPNHPICLCSVVLDDLDGDAEDL